MRRINIGSSGARRGRRVYRGSYASSACFSYFLLLQIFFLIPHFFGSAPFRGERYPGSVSVARGARGPSRNLIPLSYDKLLASKVIRITSTVSRTADDGGMQVPEARGYEHIHNDRDLSGSLSLSPPASSVSRETTIAYPFSTARRRLFGLPGHGGDPLLEFRTTIVRLTKESHRCRLFTRNISGHTGPPTKSTYRRVQFLPEAHPFVTFFWKHP